MSVASKIELPTGTTGGSAWMGLDLNPDWLWVIRKASRIVNKAPTMPKHIQLAEFEIEREAAVPGVNLP